MKAIRVHQFGGPEVLKLEDVPDPKPGPKQVVVRVKAAGVNPVDTYIRAGTYARKPPLPYTPGLDAAGIVEAVGEGVTRVAPGDRVYTAGTVSGAYAEKALCEEAQVYPLPSKITFEQGAGINIPYATAYRALFQRARARAGETVLVHGASGGVGIAAVQIARSHGLRVIGTGGTQKGRELAAREGAHHVLDHKSPGYLEKILDLTGNAGVDEILEMLANVNLGKDLKLLAPGGSVVVIGSRGTVELDPRDTMSRDAAIFGMSLANAPAKDIDSIHAALFAGLENGSLRPVVGREMRLSDAAKAHAAVLEPGAYGKTVLLP
jgi:NADPH2:quinone reductase